jgi:hypothetical protein
MRAQRFLIAGLMAAVAASVTLAQPGRGGSQWHTALADAQRTSWIRTDDKISVAAMAQPGFALQWTSKLDNQPRGQHGLSQGVSASGVTLFVPMSVVAGSSNRMFGIDNDIGYVVWERDFDVVMPPATAACPGGITAAATRIVKVDTALKPPASLPASGRGAVGYRSLVGEPGEGVPVEGRSGGRGRATGDPTAAAPAAGAGARGAALGARMEAIAGTRRTHGTHRRHSAHTWNPSPALGARMESIATTRRTHGAQRRHSAHAGK